MSKLFNINFDINKNGTIVKNVSNVDGEIVTLNTVTNVSETKTEIKTPKTKAEKVAKSKAKKQSKTDVKYIGFDKVKKGKNKGSSVKIHKKYDSNITELLRKERVLKKQLSALRKEGIKETDSSYITAMKDLSDTSKSKKKLIENQKTTTKKSK